ncbi:MAG: GGDEF domain-containing response regulator [Solirubrobacteraceae bacterium]
MLVVIADASSATRRRLGQTLRAAGHDVLDAGGAAQALALCRERRPDVLVASHALCERDRLALVDAIKSDLEIFRTAIVAIVAAELSLDTARDQLARGVQDLLVEPVRATELLARVQSAGRMKSLQEELVDQTRRLENHVFQDPLTRLYNRRFLSTQLAALASAARRHGRPLAVAMVDLDAFKAVNDRHGHDVGDRALVAAGDALARALRAEDVLGRLGGEEFLALLPDADEDAAARAAERLRAAVAGAGGPVPVTASVGWAVLQDSEDPDELVQRADTALYNAKAAGRDCVRGPATLPRRR